jgi:hypothetical protein
MSDKPISDLRRRMIADMTSATRHSATISGKLRPLPAFSAARPTLRPATTSVASENGAAA